MHSFTIKYKVGSPSSIAQWNHLTEINSNLLQSTHYDDTQVIYRQEPIYFEVFDEDGALAGGVKLYYWASRKLGIVTQLLSGTLSQMSEALIMPRYIIYKDQIIRQLTCSVHQYIANRGVVTLKIHGFYGDASLLLMPGSACTSDASFHVACVDLTQTEECLWRNIHPKHRNVIGKAINQRIIVTQEDNIEKFLFLIGQTYQNQTIHQPNAEYIAGVYSLLRRQGFATLYFARIMEEYLSGAMLLAYGKKAYYTFGGNLKNGTGAGNLLHWEITKLLKKNGYEQYILGQVAPGIDQENTKFSVGISRFKRRFGVREAPSFAKAYTIDPIRSYLWQALVKLTSLRS